MTTYTLRKGSADKVRTDLVVIGVATGKGKTLVPGPGGEPVAAAYGRGFAPLLAALGFTGGFGEVAKVPTAGPLNAGQLLVVGLGPQDALTTEKVRRAAGVAARSIGNVASVAVALPAVDAAHVRAVVDGFSAGLYQYRGLKSGPKPTAVADVVVLSDVARRADAAAALERATLVGGLADQVRDWVNTPPNVLVPLQFAAELKKATAKSGVDYELVTAAQLKKLGCGGILGVGQGSENPPCLVKLTWTPPEPQGSVALVGKGITFDSGGLTIKPAGGMGTMKSDMAGAAAVAGAIQAVAALEIPVSVTAYLPLAENMVGGASMRPGDVLTMHSGKTVEVLNTDAEGRLVLADALTMAVRDEPDVIIDVATLTGACVVALGDRIAGLFGDDEIVAEVEAAAASSGELFWHLPIPEEQRRTVRTESKVADLQQHVWVRWGSALYAAAFLEQFAEGVPWAHLDIAGPSYNAGGPWGHVPTGGTGFALSTLVELIASRAKA
ncbi:leucyl aminopeptidase [Nocardioides marmoriginsengisoli]|uniref:Probable cytosol aminopeptidase n=1 Tax=Nocardioides marmoriginsengisoli TaxID=661483 RepID=A0A3N0CLG1_9ACTN|nr:leucyl aminopeptidase [Nocardioides marmoriginsengisoli]RNL64272.1 leucyl aminopeptidase [Nocardioides marmoriginsengisoli]